MTSEKILDGISAIKIINSTVLTLSKLEENKVYCRRIQGCLGTLVDIMQEVFEDMVKNDMLLEKGMSVD